MDDWMDAIIGFVLWLILVFGLAPLIIKESEFPFFVIGMVFITLIVGLIGAIYNNLQNRKEVKQNAK